MSSLESLPAEILLEIANYLSSRSDVLQLSQVSTALYAKIIPALYADVDLHGAEQCERTLGMIAQFPQVARHVRKLTVHPEHELDPRPRDQYRAWDNAGVVSRCVMRAARNLDALVHFEWDGEDMLPDDRMWAELRARCPRLKHIGTTFGCFLPRPTSHLFQFDDLYGFALTLKDGFYAHSLHVPSRGGSGPPRKGPSPVPGLADADWFAEAESEPVFTRLWDMLALRCPALEALCIVGHSSEPSEAARLYSARWPNLKRLVLGALVWNTNAPGQPNAVPDFKDFLVAHPSIESLHLLGRPSSNQLDLSALDHEALPNLKEFSGSFAHLRMLVDRVPTPDAPAPAQNAHDANANTNPPTSGGETSLPKTLKRLCFPHAMHLRDLTPLTVSRVLMDLHALTSVKVTFAIQGGYDSNGILRTIAASCPHLLELDITCTAKPSFFLDAFANALRGLTRLRTLSLSLVRMPGEEPMHVGAARIALANPRLKFFTIAFIPAHHQSTPDAPAPPLERGAFELTCDTHGIPVCLHVAHWHSGPWPWMRMWSGAWPWTEMGARAWPFPRAADPFALAETGTGVADWFATVASALGVDTPRILLDSRAHALDTGFASTYLSWGGLLGYGGGYGYGKGGRSRGRGSVRRWVYDLRPSGHPDVPRKGVGELLVERSPAGEEARLMLFCLALLVLTVWALVSKAVREA
ncbi:hypothetical protein BV20DRAFT_1049515 [Pilatotrama ljubarskyi]|nr:hypothetical protein BV20DRAFT_1049515 [Pilatotrama ljubarskyi]